MHKNEKQRIVEEQTTVMNRLLYPDYDQLSAEDYFSPVEVFKQEVRRRLYGKALLNQGVDTNPNIWLLSPWSVENFCRREVERFVWQEEALDNREQQLLDLIFNLRRYTVDEHDAQKYFSYAWKSYRSHLTSQTAHNWEDFQLCIIYENTALVTYLWKDAILAIWKHRGHSEKKLKYVRYIFVADRDIVLFEVGSGDFLYEYYSIVLRDFYRLEGNYDILKEDFTIGQNEKIDI